MLVRAVVFDYFFTLADPGVTTMSTIDEFVADVLPHMTSQALLASREEWLARRPAIGVPVQPTSGGEHEFESYAARWHSYGEDWLAHLGVANGGDRWASARYRAHAIAPLYDDVRPALAAARARNTRLGVLSDADTGYLTENLALHGLELDAVVSSEELRCYKPHPAMFAEVCRRLGADPGEVLYVGDSPTRDVEGACCAGLRAVWLNRASAEWPLEQPPPAEIPTLAAVVDLVENPPPVITNA